MATTFGAVTNADNQFSVMQTMNAGWTLPSGQTAVNAGTIAGGVVNPASGTVSGQWTVSGGGVFNGTTGTSGGDGTSAVGIQIMTNLNKASTMTINPNGIISWNASGGSGEIDVITQAGNGPAIFSAYKLSGSASPWTITGPFFSVNDDGSIWIPSGTPSTASGTFSQQNNLPFFSGQPIGTIVATVQEVEITSASTYVTIASYTPVTSGNFEVNCYFRVVTGTTTVIVVVTYADVTGAQTLTLLPSTSEAVGSYSVPFSGFINAVSGTAIELQVNASVADQVYASGDIMARG